MNPLKQKMTMKMKNMFWAALSMTAALVMTACSSDDNMTETPQTPSTSKKIPYTVTVGEATTRANIVEPDHSTLYFATGDKLYITGDDIQGVLDLQDGDEGKTSGATFSGELTYSGSGSPASDLSLTATLVSAQQTVGTQVSVDGAGAVTVNYPTAAYCSSINDAVQKYSQLTGTSTYGAKAFTLTQQTAFLNFEITFADGTTTGTNLSAVVSNGGSALCTANVTTTTESEKVVAKFVLPVAAGTTLSSANVKFGDKEAISFGASQVLDGKVYNVKKTQAAATAGHALSASAVGEVVGTDGMAYDVADKDNLPTGVTAAGMVAYKSGSNGLVIALADEASTMNWSTANGASGAAAHTPTVTGQTWKLPSQAEWKQMFSANGGNQNSYTGLNTALAAAGGDSSKLREGAYYWSSSEGIPGISVYYVYLLNGSASWSSGRDDYGLPVRACLAF